MNGTVVLFIFASVASLISLILELLKPENRSNVKVLLLTIQFIIMAFLLGSSYQAMLDNTIWQSKIDRTTSNTEDIAVEIKKLSNINDSISRNVSLMVDSNTTLLGQTKRLSENIDTLVLAAHSLSETINQRTKLQVLENSLQGELDFFNNQKLEDTEIVEVLCGGIPASWTVSLLKNGGRSISVIPLMIGTTSPVRIGIYNNKLVFNLVVYDLDNQWVAEIVNNQWRRNPNYTGKFNYDKSGFEISDNRGKIILSANFSNKKSLELKGYYAMPKEGVIVFFGDNGTTVFRPDKNFNYDVFDKQLDTAGVTPLFSYFGEDWLGKRLPNTVLKKKQRFLRF